LAHVPIVEGCAAATPRPIEEIQLYGPMRRARFDVAFKGLVEQAMGDALTRRPAVDAPKMADG
jgi:hypothetical protein